MCIAFLAFQQHPEFPLIIASNRDEWWKRKALPSSLWKVDETNCILSGVDCEGKGTWFGFHPQKNMWALLTNFRNPALHRKEPISRGKIVLDALTTEKNLLDFLEELSHNKLSYDPWNLLCGDAEKIHFASHQQKEIQSFTQGFFGLSNALLNTPWPKVNRGLQRFEHAVKSEKTKDSLQSELWNLLADSHLADPAQLPNTGIPQHIEYSLSSIFVSIPELSYGTTQSTLFFIDKKGCYECREKTILESSETKVCGQLSF